MTHTIETLANLFILHMFRTVRTVRITGICGSSLDDAVDLLFPHAGPEWLETDDPDYEAVNWPRHHVYTAIHWLYGGMLRYRVETANAARYTASRWDLDEAIFDLAKELQDNAGIDARLFAYYAKQALLSGPTGIERRIVNARTDSQLSLGL
jgi:hypothetical protein